MKRTIIIFLSLFLFSCSRKILQQTSFEGKNFESAMGPLFGGNKISLNIGNTFNYIGHGPSVFISAGYWKYDKLNKEIKMISDASFNSFSARVSIDTIWTDLSDKRIKVNSGKEILFDGLIYKLKRNKSR